LVEERFSNRFPQRGEAVVGDVHGVRQVAGLRAK
jgi:hypothetical protein